MLLRNNPEFIKNVWTEFSSLRLTLMPIILGLLFYTIYLSNQPTEYSQPHEQIEAVIYGGIYLFIIIVYLWGAKLTSDTVLSEVNNRTWINQRLSAISPWQMTIGKLFGSSIYAWYGGGIVSFITLILATQTPYLFLISKLFIILTLGGIFVQAFALNLTLLGIQKDQFYNHNYKSIFYFLLALLFTAPFIGIFMEEFSNQFYTFYYKGANQTLTWYYTKIHKINFFIFSGILFVFWVIIGTYQNFRSEFQFKNGSLIWCLFLTNLILYVIGFVFTSDFKSHEILFLSSLTALIFVGIFYYFLLLTESKDLVYLQQLEKSIKEKNWEKLNFNLPLYTITFVFILLISLMCLYGNSINLEKTDYDKVFLLFPINVILFLLRDTFLILWVHTSNYRRKELTSIFYLSLLYILFPLITSLLTQGEKLLGIFYPMFSEIPSITIGILPIFFQLIIISILFFINWKKQTKVS